MKRWSIGKSQPKMKQIPIRRELMAKNSWIDEPENKQAGDRIPLPTKLSGNY
jgi:hypothetical protein